MIIQFYNSLTKTKSPFVPIHEGQVSIYCCGPTVYSNPHVGHAKSAVTYDLLVRFLRYQGYMVRYVRNITDVGHLVDDADEGEDKIIKRSRLEKLEPMELVEKYTQNYFDAMDRLNILRPNISPRASAHIPEQIEAIEHLIKRSYAYEVNGSVYFDINTFPSYGKLSNRDLSKQQVSVRNTALSEKKHEEDFALWKKADPKHILQWNSPWGKGYPGWHIECSVMSMKYLGENFDIHGGGMDLQFPHHESEIAQAESLTGKPFANYWLHNGMVTIDGLKMSKSLGNFIEINELLEQWDPRVIRYFVISSHYRTNLDFNKQALENAKKNLEKLYSVLKNVRVVLKQAKLDKTQKVENNIDRQRAMAIDNLKVTFLDKIADDLNTPEAIAEIFSFLKENKKLFGSLTDLRLQTLELMDDVFTDLFVKILGLQEPQEETVVTYQVDRLIRSLLQLRERMRKKRFFKEGDEIRKIIIDVGYTVSDKKIKNKISGH